MPHVSNRRAATLSVTLAALALAGCTIHPVADQEIPGLTAQQLLEGIVWHRGQVERDLFGLHDSSYAPKLVRELGRREGWTDEQIRDVLANRLWIGATQQQLVAACGWPRERTDLVRKHGSYATWRYGSGSKRYSVDLTDGVVTGWTMHRD